MARWYEPRQDQIEEFEAWAKSRPESIRELVLNHPIWNLYRLKSTNQIVVIYSFSTPPEGSDRSPTVTVVILGYKIDGLGMVARPQWRVFGLDPAELEVYDPPHEQELMLWSTRAAGGEVDESVPSCSHPRHQV